MFNEFVSLLSAYGPAGIGFSLVVLILIYVARVSGLVITGNQARLANVLLSVILSGLAADPGAGKSLEAILISLVSSLLYELFKYAQSKRSPAG